MTGQLAIQNESRYITFSNALARARHNLQLHEKRVVALAIAMMDSKAPLPLGNQGVPYSKITAADYAESFGVDLATAYSQLQAAGRALRNRYIMFYEPAYRRNGKPLAPTIVEMNWVGSIKYHKGEGWLELHWWPHLLKHLMAQSKEFTTLKLHQTSALRSVYSWKLLELLQRFKGASTSGVAHYTIEDFSLAMGATEKQQENFAKIRTKIIEPAVKELTQKDGWSIEWRPIKAGRKVKSIEFKFERNRQGQLPLE